MADAVAVVLFVAVTAYAVFGGADFGAGFWDLVAGGADRGARPRALIDHSIGPVWEANHVWLIFALVVLWTGFPEAFASITLTLFVPLTLAALGIVLRGASFAFRKTLFRTSERRVFGRDLRHLVDPRALLHGGRGRCHRVGPGPGRRQGGRSLDELDQPRLGAGWGVGRDGRRLPGLGVPHLGRPPARRRRMVGYFRQRAIVAAIVAGAVAFVGIFVLRADARYVFDGLTSRALPLVLLSALCGVGSLVLLRRRAHRGARVAAMGAVASIVWAWGVAQWSYILPTSLKVSAAAAPSATLGTVLVVFGVAAVVIVPSLALLYVLDQRSLLPEESVDARPAVGGS